MKCKICHGQHLTKNHIIQCRYCHDIIRWDGDAPLPEPLRLGDKGLYELHCGYDGAPSPRFTFTCPVCDR
jgi:hypothetical protein